jgi:hypothetical protein
LLAVTTTWDELDRFEEEYDRALVRLSNAVRRGVARAVDEGAREGMNTRRYQDQTGLLTSMIKGWVEISTPGGAEGMLGAFTEYASYVDAGTAPHKIRGNPWLVFKTSDGRWVRVHEVDHPGTKPDGFGGRMYLKAERVILREVELGVAELARMLGLDYSQAG